MKKVFLILAVAIVGLASCKKDDDMNVGGIFKGPVKDFQDGKAWTWVQLAKNGTPERIGIAIDDAAMASLDMGEGEGDGGHNHTNNLSLAFHPKAAATPFKHALLDWNPHGHEPAGIYDLPHFDFHFYMTSEAERLQIPLYEQDSMKFKNYPAPGFMPENYFPIPGGVPAMGTHWPDAASGELNGQVFTQTFLYGSYDGKVTFYEPMITKAFLDANLAFTRSIGVPSKFAVAGYYPTEMRIEKGNGVTNIILSDFKYRAKN
jgi:hypothetical protein